MNLKFRKLGSVNSLKMCNKKLFGKNKIEEAFDKAKLVNYLDPEVLDI